MVFLQELLWITCEMFPVVSSCESMARSNSSRDCLSVQKSSQNFHSFRGLQKHVSNCRSLRIRIEKYFGTFQCFHLHLFTGKKMISRHNYSETINNLNHPQPVLIITNQPPGSKPKAKQPEQPLERMNGDHWVQKRDSAHVEPLFAVAAKRGGT